MSVSAPAAVVLLAAGAGTRMKSTLPKVLHRVCGVPMVGHALNAAFATGANYVVAVVRHEREKVAGAIQESHPQALIADQDDLPGTGRAVECGLAALPADLEGTLVVTYGDVPLLQGDTLTSLVAAHEAAQSGVTVVTSTLADATGYGRIIRSADGQIDQIVEHKDALAQVEEHPEYLATKEVNSGIYAFDLALLRSILPKIGTANKQNEKYLTDTVGLARAAGRTTAAYELLDVAQTEGVNDRVQLAALEHEMNRRLLVGHMKNGVTFQDPSSVHVEATVKLAQDVTILPGVQLLGDTSVDSGSVIGPDCTLENVTVGANAKVFRSHALDSQIGEEATVGPFSYLRPGTALGARGKIGTFVETKKASIGEGSKIPHLSYIGDAVIGVESNIGCASVTVNYDGVNKHQTTIGNHCRTGSDTMFVAPVTVGDGAYTGAGTVVRKNVPPGALAISVAPQRNLVQWAIKKRPGSAAANAATAALAEEE